MSPAALATSKEPPICRDENINEAVLTQIECAGEMKRVECAETLWWLRS